MAYKLLKYLFSCTGGNSGKKHVIVSEGKINNLPLDLEMEILSRLGLKQLHRCRCVSRCWRDLISTQTFTKVYRHRHAYEGNSDGLLILMNGANSMYTFDFHTSVLKEITHRPPHGYGLSDVYKFLLPCNGLLCFGGVFHGHRRLLIFNPATGARKCLKRLPYRDDFLDTYYGFCYDHVSDDYKIVIVKHKSRSNRRYRENGYVYSLKANTWKTIVKPYWSAYSRATITRGKMVFLNNRLHWVSPYDEHIARFELGTEEYDVISLPNHGHKIGTYTQYIWLSALQGCLHVINTMRKEFWIMKEYGVAESWTVLFKFPPQSTIPRKFYGLDLYAYSEDGQEVLAGEIRGTDYVACNLVSQEVRSVQVCSLPSTDNGNYGFVTTSWTEGSLVSPIDD